MSTEQVDSFFYSFHSLHVIYIWNIIFTFGKEKKRREEITFRYLFICERLISSCSSHISYLRCYKMTLEMTHGHKYWKQSYQEEGQKEVVCVSRDKETAPLGESGCLLKKRRRRIRRIRIQFSCTFSCTEVDESIVRTTSFESSHFVSFASSSSLSDFFAMSSLACPQMDTCV